MGEDNPGWKQAVDVLTVTCRTGEDWEGAVSQLFGGIALLGLVENPAHADILSRKDDAMASQLKSQARGIPTQTITPK